MDLNNNVAPCESKSSEDVDKNDLPIVPATRELKIKCNICEKLFFRELMNKHMRVSHPGVSYRLPKIKKAINPEKLKPTENGKVICQCCEKTFCNMFYAKKHYLNQHAMDKKDLKFKCKLCEKRFALKKYRKVHMQNPMGCV